jgi:plasmid stability protein
MTFAIRRQSTTLTVRNIEPALRDRRRVRAARHDHSIEALAILRDTLGREQADEPNLGEAIRRRFAPFGGVELDEHPPVAHPS